MSQKLVEDFLKRNGPSRASDIVKHLQTTRSLSDVAARQAVSRARGAILRLQGLRFGKGEKVLYLKDQLGTKQFAQQLIGVLMKSNSSGGRAVRGIGMKGGAILESQFSSVAGAITVDRKGHIRSSTLLEVLVEYGVVKKSKTPSGRQLLELGDHKWGHRHEVLWNAETIALNLVKEWACRMNLGSYRDIRVRSEDITPDFNGFRWDMTSPCYLAPLLSWSEKQKKVSPGFIVADVILGEHLTLPRLSAFIHKVEAACAQKNNRPLIPIIVCETLEREALLDLRKRGYITATTRAIFGKDAADLLKELSNFLINANESIVSQPSGVYDLFERLRGIEVDLRPMRGPLFEYIVGNLLSKEGFRVDMNRVVKTPEGDSVEIDVRAEGRGALIAAECKGLGPEARITAPVIDDWLNRQIPRIRQWHHAATQVKGTENTLEFHFYYSGEFDPGTRAYCNSVTESRTKYRVEFFDYNSVSTRLKSVHENSALKTLNEYFRSPGDELFREGETI